MTLLFPKFLSDENQYAQSEAHWECIWASTSLSDRFQSGWQSYWFPKQLPKDGNPIFSAVSTKLKKGIRIIQYEATAANAELDFWIDTFGGPATDPDAITELVIACALSTESSQMARRLISSWLVGDIVLANNSGFPRALTTIDSRRLQRTQFNDDSEFELLQPAA